MTEVVIVTALGRVNWSFLVLAQTVSAMLVESGQRTAVELRAMASGGRERALVKLRQDLLYRSAPMVVIEEVDAAISGFARARADYERAVAAVEPFTIAAATDFQSPDELAACRRDPALVAAELRTIADGFEDAASQLGRARRLLRGVT